MIPRLWTSFCQLLLPRHCLACDRPAPAEGRLPLCEPCSRALATLISAPHCVRCGRSAGPHGWTDAGCALCRRDFPVDYDGAVRLGPYAEPLRTLVLRLKYGGRQEIAPLLGRLLAERVALAPWADQADLVVPVPLHWSRRISRGYNQAVLIARHIMSSGALRGRIRLAPRLLVRRRFTLHQARLAADQRRRNVSGAFRLGLGGAAVKGRCVVLVDDVITSGTTVAECVRLLRRAGAAAVYLAVAATADYDEQGPW